MDAELKSAGNALFKAGDYAAALAKYDEAVAINPLPVYYANRAQCELKLEQYGSAIETCTLALELDPENAKCYYRRAIAYSGTVQHSKAVADFQKVVSLQPSLAEARNRLKAAQSLARYVAFQLAIQTEDEPTIFESFDHTNLPETDGNHDFQLDLDAISDADIERLVEYFKSGKRLPRKLCFEIVKRVSALTELEPVMPEIDIPEGGKVTVCGDTHGQFYDLLNIFSKNGYPSSDHIYGFNGAFVDRGSWSTEVALTLYILKLKNPKSIIINRGNHETDSMNTIYGFSGECKSKYGHDYIYKAFCESFTKLPVATVVGGAYFVVHGGVASEDAILLEDIRKIDRNNEKQPSQSGLLIELLWSDPQPLRGLAPSKRGIAHMFGPDVTQRFIERNKLRKIIRSHEVRDDGYLEEHNNQLVTVFSAPNYCDSVGNKGAYITITPDLEMAYTQFTAVPHPNIPPMAYSSGLMR